MTAPDPRLGMPEVIWAHLEHHGDDYDLERSRDIRNLADDLTDLLTAAGYGLVADAKREAEVSCPTRLMDGRNEIRCWLTAGHEGACK